MNTKMQMKMAKASQQDIDAAVRLVSILGDIDKGYYPSAPDAEDADEPTFFDVDDPEHLRAFYDRVKGCLDVAPGGMFRVIWGFSTIMSNDMVDPSLDYLEFHPRIVEALARSPVVGAPLAPESLLDIARDTGLRSFLHGVNAVDARAILATFQSAVDAEREATASAQAPVVDAQAEAKVSDELVGVAEVIAEGGGFWRTCCGCHEIEDGQPIGHYPYSKVMKCDLGAGCGDCGGIGAVWDNTDYEAMGRDIEAHRVAAIAAPAVTGDGTDMAEAVSDADVMNGVDRAVSLNRVVWKLAESMGLVPAGVHRIDLDIADTVAAACRILASHESAPTDDGRFELLKKAHRAIDLLLAQLVIAVPDFRPTQSPVWPDLELIAAAVRPSKASHA